MDEKRDGDFLLLAHRIDGLRLVPYHRIEVSKPAQRKSHSEPFRYGKYKMICLSARLKKEYLVASISVADPDQPIF